MVNVTLTIDGKCGIGNQ